MFYLLFIRLTLNLQIKKILSYVHTFFKRSKYFEIYQVMNKLYVGSIKLNCQTLTLGNTDCCNPNIAEHRLVWVV